MGKRRLPPPTGHERELFGPTVVSFTVGSWCPSRDGTGPATAVGISIETERHGDLVLRLKSPRAVDQMIQMLLRHKRDVWPEAP